MPPPVRSSSIVGPLKQNDQLLLASSSHRVKRDGHDLVHRVGNANSASTSATEQLLHHLLYDVDRHRIADPRKRASVRVLERGGDADQLSPHVE